MRILLVALTLMFGSIAQAQEAEQLPPEAIAEVAIKYYISPATNAFSHAAMDQEALLSALCRHPSHGALQHARLDFRTLVDAWARIAFLQFGPLTTDNRFERILLWPDRKGIALKQVQEVLATADESATDWRTLQNKSVALQGLTALEFALFGSGSDDLSAGEAQQFRCRFAHAVAGALRSVAQNVARDWRPDGVFAQRLIRPGIGDVDYRSTREVLEELVGAAAHGIEGVRDTQMLPFLGRTKFDPKPKSALFWRSEQTFPVIAAAFDGIDRFIRAARLGDAVGEDNRWLQSSVDFDFAQAREVSARITSPIAEALDDPAQVQAMNDLLALTRDLQGLLGDSLPKLLGLSVGFSALDGD